jgi:putative addiction module component (TIGR02574 family)
MRRALELDEAELSAEDQSLVESRLAEYRQNPESAVGLEAMKVRLRARFSR